MRDPEAVTTLQYHPEVRESIEFLLSQNLHEDNRQPMMVAQVYDEDAEDEMIASVWFQEEQARALRNHLNRFLAHCQRHKEQA